MTPGRRPLAVPHGRIADAVRAEWAGQGEFIDPATMPVTRLANTAIDGVANRRDEVRRDILAYAGTDLLYYRAEEPQGLVARQNAAWDPILEWAERRFSARFIRAAGIAHVAQPEPALAAIAARLAGEDDPFRLAGLHLATTLSGSALIALALAEGVIGTDAAWAAAHVDEDWNISRWGADAEAMRRRARRFEDFRAAALALA
jgi:chaperone required for assembly of F1-ATPase